jgi:Glycosyl hydrolase family 46
MSDKLIEFGIACIAAAIVGGGFKAFGVEIPLIGSYLRQILLALLGAAVLIAGVKLRPPRVEDARLGFKVFAPSGASNLLVAVTPAQQNDWTSALTDPPNFEVTLRVRPKISHDLLVSGKNIKQLAFHNVISPGGGEERWYRVDVLGEEATGDGKAIPVKGRQEFAALPDLATPVFASEAQRALPLVSQSQLDSSDLLHRLVLLTAAFEVGSTAPDEIFNYVTGNFDGQGITVGPVGFTWRADEIQRLLRVMEKDHPGVLRRTFGEQYVELSDVLGKDTATQMAWAARLSAHNGASIAEPWLTRFRNLGRTPEFQDVTYAEIRNRYFDRAIKQCDQLGLHSQRGLALVFDTDVQTGERGLSHALHELATDAQLKEGDEVARMIVIAHAVADSSNPRYRADVLNRKMIFATGEGVLRRTKYDLSAYKITLEPWKR